MPLLFNACLLMGEVCRLSKPRFTPFALSL
ncbi:Uncharacterised protein [Vibrio cholerae]|nr:Uncharacterised protein [Vibrio cholerae]CSI60683.1 Uncharacterised protein [Vibrio cholerae]